MSVTMRGAMSPGSYSAGDFTALGGYNVNVLRWQIMRNWAIPDAELDLNDWNTWFAGKLNELDLVMVAARQNDIKVIIDVHTPPGGRAANQTMYMFYQTVYRDRFISAWQEIANRYKNNNAVWAYDLINEPYHLISPQTPVPPAGMDLRSTQVDAANAVRAIDPVTPIIIESFGGHPDGWSPFYGFSPITGINSLWYSVHVYAYNFAINWETPTGADCYPGVIRGTLVDKPYLYTYIQNTRNFQVNNNVKMYVGEFSIPVGACGANQYLRDNIDIWEEYGWDWTYHAFRESPEWSMEAADRGSLMLEKFSPNLSPYALPAELMRARPMRIRQ